jgi:hypothetical protein
MNRSVRFLGPLGILGVGLLMAAAGVWSNGGTVGAQTAVMKVVPASQTVDIGGGNFTVDIVVEDVSNLASFEFTLTFDPSVLRLVGVTKGPFLDSTGRSVFCPRPIYNSPAPSVPSQDAVRFGCASSDHPPEEEIPGASGTGVVATVTFAPRKAGTSQLWMGLAQDIYGLADPLSEDIPLVPQGGSVEVVGNGPAATPDPDEPTPIPAESPPPPIPSVTPTGISWLTPEPGETPMTRPIDGSYMTGGSTGSSSSSGDEVPGTAGGSPRAGEGPPEKDADWWPALAGGLLAAGGAALLSLSFHLRRSEPARRIRHQ